MHDPSYRKPRGAASRPRRNAAGGDEAFRGARRAVRPRARPIHGFARTPARAGVSV